MRLPFTWPYFKRLIQQRTDAPPARDFGGKRLYVCHGSHPNDRIYLENLADFFGREGLEVAGIELSPDGSRNELLVCLSGSAFAVLGINAQLDHSWIGQDSFLDLAARAHIPVIHWVLDHSSSRWPEFSQATVKNSRFVFLSPFSESYFQRYGLPGSLTTCTAGNTGASPHARIARVDRREFMARSCNCLIPINLRRIGGTLDDALRRRNTLEPKLAQAVDQAIESAYPDLDLPIETHLLDALAQTGIVLAGNTFHFCIQIIEEVTQIKRRQWILRTARDYPVLIQSDDTAAPFVSGGRARFEADVDMKTTICRMKDARAVLNVSHVNDEIHNRTINGLNAGCANILEDNVVHRRLFTHRRNALFFRYDDDSLRQCLDVVCSKPWRAFRIGAAGFRMRKHEPFDFGGFDNIIKIAQSPLPATAPNATRAGAPSS